MEGLSGFSFPKNNQLQNKGISTDSTLLNAILVVPNVFHIAYPGIIL